jgi:hypothetical protein
MQVQLSIVRSSASPNALSRGSTISSQSKDLDDDPYWEIARNGSIIIRRRLGELRLFRPYQVCFSVFQFILIYDFSFVFWPLILVRHNFSLFPMSQLCQFPFHVSPRFRIKIFVI